MNGRAVRGEQLLGPGGLVWTEFKQATGYRAVSGLGLAFEAEVHSASRLGEATLDMRATVSVDQSQTGWFRLGTAFATSPLHLPPGGEYRQRPVTMEIIVDQLMLAVLESQRNGGDLRLRVGVVATATTSTGDGLVGSHTEQWTIPGEQWVSRVLAQGHAHRHLTILTPAPSATSSDSYRLADEQLQIATTALRAGRYGDAVMAVRKGTDVLGSRRNAAPNKKPVDRSVDERFGGLASALHDLTSAFAHLEGSNATYRWTRPDAMAAIAGLIGLMQRTAGLEDSI